MSNKEGVRNRAGRPADVATAQCLIVLQTLAEASPAVVPTELLLERAQYSAPEDESRRRSLRRHITSLVQAGHPIEAVADIGLAGGYRMMVRDPQLEAALTLAQRHALIRVAMWAKLEAAAGALGTEGGVAPSTSIKAVASPPAQIDVVHAALTRRCGLEFEYNGRPRLVYPHRLSCRGYEWQLDAYELEAEREKTFVVARMDNCALGTVAEPRKKQTGADDPDPVNWHIDRPVDATVSVATIYRPDVERALGGAIAVREIDAATGDANAGAGDAGGDGASKAGGDVILTIPVTNRLVFRSRLLALGPRATLLGPADLRDDLLAHLRELAGTP